MKGIRSYRKNLLAAATTAVIGTTPVTAQTLDEAVTVAWSNGTLHVQGTSGNDDLSIASKNDLIEVNGGMIPVVGGTPTTRNTHLIVVQAGNGDDEITFSQWGESLPDAQLDGGEGNDLLIGGDGVDVLRGGAGNDVLIGGRGNDVMLGQDGNDLLIWNNGDGSDFLEGGEGFDFVQVNGANGAGDDFLIEPDGDRFWVRRSDLEATHIEVISEKLAVHGHGGDDSIGVSDVTITYTGLEMHGGDGNDLLVGGVGNDWLVGGTGNDVLLGEEGSDIIIVNDGDGSDTIEGGEGFDFVQVNGSNTAGDDFSIDPNGQRVRFQRNNLGLFTLDIGTTENLDVNGQGGSDVIIGSTGLAGLIHLDLTGGAGDDMLMGSDGDDGLHGGTGNDVLLGDRGNDTIDGGEGTDACDGGGGRDRLTSCEAKVDRQ